MNGKLGYRSNPKFFDQHILPMPNPMSNEKTPGCQMIPFSAVWPGQDQRRRRLDLQHGDAWAGNLSWSNYSDLTRPGPPNGGLVREAVWPKFPVLGRIRQIGLMLSPCLPTSVGSSKCNLMGILTPHDEMASHRGGMTFGFRPYWFQSGVKQFLCDEDRCTIFLPHGRVECLNLKHGDHISLVNATIETNRHDSGYKWHVTVDSFPTTLVGVHAKREDVLKTIDLFAGLTNWSMTAKAMGLHPCVSIEKDEQIGEVGAMNLKAPFWTAEDFVKHWENDFGRMYYHVDIMLLADVQNEFIREPLSHYRSGMLVGSPPCPPWSRLSSMLGLADSRGRLIMTVADIAQFLGSRIVALENVANILNHPD